MRFLRYIIVCICILYLNTLVVAQGYTPFKPIEGTLSKVIYCVFQDSKGYIWIGTESGVSRYDGYGFKHYTKDDGLSDNEIFQIHEDYKGRLWFLTYNGEPTLYDNGKILTATNTSFLRSIKPGIISRGFINRQDSIWYISRNNAYLFVNDQLKNTITAQDYNKMYGGYVELSSYTDKVAFLTKSLIYYPESNEKKIIPKQLSLAFPNTRALYIGNELIFYNNTNLFVYNTDSTSIKTIPIPIKYKINAVTYDAKRKVMWLVTDANLYEYDYSKRKILRTIVVNIAFANFICVDKENNIWLSSSNKGVYLSHPSFVNSVEYNSQFSNDAAYCISMFKGTIYAGHNNGEYLTWKNNIANYNRAPGENRLDKIYGFSLIGNTFFATYGARIFDATQPDKKQFYTGAKAITSNKEFIYIAYSYQVVKLSLSDFRKRSQNTNVTRYKTVYDKRVNAMLMSGNDTLYLGAIDGLKILAQDSIILPPKHNLDVFNCTVSKMAFTPGKLLVFATAGKGIGILTPTNCYIINKESGLSSNVCNSVYAENDNTLWVATNKGISRVEYTIRGNKIASNIQNYSVINGLPSANVNDVLVNVDTVWLATDNGVCFFLKKQMDFQASVPMLNFENFLVNNTPADISRTIKLPYTSNNISISYTGISFHKENAVVYKYKLIGADTGWSYTNARIVEYPHLLPGQYTFIITAANTNATYWSAIKKISFTITPPFWKTAWFVALIMIVTVSIVVWAVSFRIKTIHKKHVQESNTLRLLKEKAEFEKQLIELEQKALNLQMNPHFIFNAMNAIKGYYAHNNREAADTYIDNFATLMRMILEYNTRNTLLLYEEIDLLNAYLELAAIRKDDNFTFNIKVEDGVNIWRIQIPPMLLQPFVENAVIHGISSLTANGHIDICFSVLDNMLQCIVTDNGIGRKKSQALNRFRTHQSKGITITEQRLQLLSPDSRLYINDITDNDGIVTGTKVTILIYITFK